MAEHGSRPTHESKPTLRSVPNVPCFRCGIRHGYGQGDLVRCHDRSEDFSQFLEMHIVRAWERWTEMLESIGDGRAPYWPHYKKGVIRQAEKQWRRAEARRRKSVDRTYVEDLAKEPESRDSHVYATEAKDETSFLLNSITTKMRQAVLMQVDGATAEEIATALGLSTRSVYRLIEHARDVMADMAEDGE